MNKTVCPITRAEFHANAKPLAIKIGDQLMSAVPQDFATGSMGYFTSGKVTVMVGEVPVSVQVGLNLTVVGSKELDDAADVIAAKKAAKAPAQAPAKKGK